MHGQMKVGYHLIDEDMDTKPVPDKGRHTLANDWSAMSTENVGALAPSDNSGDNLAWKPIDGEKDGDSVAMSTETQSLVSETIAKTVC